MTANGSWHEKAACKGVDVEVFFDGCPSGITAALEICYRCPVMRECSAAGDMEETEGQLFGVRGGETADKRMSRRAHAAWGHKLIDRTVT
jgi:hypothetical protein